MQGQAAYVPQVAVVHNMTIRDNIVYGKQFDLGRYNHVIRHCQLLQDFNSLPAGDLTEVGEKVRLHCFLNYCGCRLLLLFTSHM